MGWLAEPFLRTGGEHRAGRVGKWVASTRRDIRGHHRLYVVAFEIGRPVVASGSLGDDPVFGSLGSAVYFSGYRYFTIVQALSR